MRESSPTGTLREQELCSHDRRRKVGERLKAFSGRLRLRKSAWQKKGSLSRPTGEQILKEGRIVKIREAVGEKIIYREGGSKGAIT